MSDPLDALASADLVYRPGDLFNPPGLVNFWGQVQTALDPVAVQHLTFPPFSCGDVVLGALLLDGERVGRHGAPITFRWRPDRIERMVEQAGWRITSRTVLPLHTQQILVAVEVTNISETERTIDARLRTAGGVIHSTDGWHTPYAPKEGPTISVTPWEGTPPAEQLVENERTVLTDDGAVLYGSRTSTAWALHAVAPHPEAIEESTFRFDRTLAPGASFSYVYRVELGSDPRALRDALAAWRAEPYASFETAQQDWEAEWEAVFTPGNDRYSGHLPRLNTGNAALRRVYETAILGAVVFKREHPASAYGRTYTTLTPRYWVTTSFINDWSLSAYLLALLDPACVRRQVSLWLERDVHAHFGTEYVSGRNAGNWYSCNDFAIVRLVSAYVRTTGDLAWLDTRVGPRSVFEHVVALATHVDALDSGRGLADGGDRNSLLECVGGYTHEVASINAGYVWALREAAALAEHRGDARAGALRGRAARLAQAVQQLYRPGTGAWVAQQPDGSRRPVHHAWDFVHTANFLYGDLPKRQRAELFAFFERDLQTPTWLRALATYDADADFSLRPDHQWNGSYPAWVALASRALARDGRWDVLDTWISGLARSARQGPYGQAHFAEGAAPLLAGGARKAPTEWPYITDWACLAAGGFVELVLLDLFGLNFGLNTLTAAPRLDAPGPEARLTGIMHHGRRYDADADGLHPA